MIFALDRAGITGPDGPSHHGLLDLALCLKVPGMTIFAPSSAQELKNMLATALDIEGPVAIRLFHGCIEHSGELTPLLFQVLQQPERRPDDFTDIVVAPLGDALAGKALQFGGQVHIGRHRSTYVHL